MRMSQFRVMDYRCFRDSGWISIEDIAVIVGKNESGKTSLLRALHKFNPHKEAPYSLDREWPRGRRKERSEETNVVSIQFVFDDTEKAQLAAIHDSARGIEAVEITKNYRGSYTYRFLPDDPNHEHELKWVVSVIKEHFGTAPEGASQHFTTQYKERFAGLVSKVREQGGSAYAITAIPSLKKEIQNCVSPNHPENTQDSQILDQVRAQMDAAVTELQIDPPVQQAIDMVHEWIPTFIYMDDFQIFRGTAHLDQIKQRKDARQLTDEDKTIIMIMEMAGLDLEEEYRKGKQPDREQRILDMNDASQTLTDEIADRWRQRQYEVMFQADGFHFITFVKDLHAKVLVPLEERSKGFQWFFSFDMKFMYESNGGFKNSVLLLDEPGLHLHAAAQRDLLKRMNEYSKNNQLVYTTHLPFMIDLTRLDNIWVAEEVGGGETKVHHDWATAGEDARFTLQAALGLSWSQSLFVGKYNLVVEGVSDFWYLTTISALLQEAGEQGLDDILVVTPAGGASKAAYVGTILHGQELHVCVLLDSDPEGKSAYEQLVHQWILKENHVLMLGQVIGTDGPCAIEDLFDEEYYLSHVHAAYAKELAGKKLTLPKKKETIVDRVGDALMSRGVEHFNKGRVGKSIMKDLSKKSASDLPASTRDRFRQVFDTANEILRCWKSAT